MFISEVLVPTGRSQKEVATMALLVSPSLTAPAVLMLILQVSSSVQKAMRPTTGLAALKAALVTLEFVRDPSRST